MRVLALLGSRVLFGQERMNIHVLQRLTAEGCVTLTIAQDHPGFPRVRDELASRRLDFVTAPFVGRYIKGYIFDFLIGNIVRFFVFNVKLSLIIREFKPTHIQIPNPFFFLSGYIALSLFNVPIIYRIGDKPSAHNWFWTWLWRRIIKRTTHFVADSDFIARELIALGGDSRRITVIHNEPPVRLRGPMPGRLPVDPQKFLFIGQIDPGKGVDRLAEAFTRIVSEYPSASLTLIGPIPRGPLCDWARALVDRMHRGYPESIKFIGESDDIYEYLAAAAVLFVPSVWEEALSTVVGEAKAAARPAVVFPRGGLPEIIEHGVDGYICRDVSVEALEEGLRFYLDHPELVQEHGRAALSSIASLGIDQFSRKWLEVYQKTLPTSGID